MSDQLVLFSLIASGASVILAVIAIWVALYGKAEADKTNQKTQELLTEIRTDARSIAQVAMPELKAYGDSVRRHIFKEDGTAPDSGAERIEKSVNEAMDKIMHELREVKELPDLKSAFDRLEKVEAQIDQSRKTIEKSVREEREMITIDSESMSYEFAPNRSTWVLIINRFMEHLELQERNYGIAWEIRSKRTNKPLKRDAVFDTHLSLKAAGIRGGDIFVLEKI